MKTLFKVIVGICIVISALLTAKIAIEIFAPNLKEYYSVDKQSVWFIMI